MSPARDKILALVAAGTITADDGSRLLAALKAERSRLDIWLIEPFEIVQLPWAWGVAALVCAGSLGLSLLGIRFDGTLDLHAADEPVTWAVALADQLVAWPLTAMVFWLVARLARQRARLLELVAFVGAARLPQLVAGLLAALAGLFGGAEEQTVAGLVVVALLLPLVCWTVLILLSAFRVASATRGRGLAATFCLALASAEALSKVVLFALT